MVVKQLASFLNESFKEVTGREDIVKEDLSDLVDSGKEITGLSVDDFKSVIMGLLDRIGILKVRSRLYKGLGHSILRENVINGFGSGVLKYDIELPSVQDNPAWQLEEGKSIDPFVVTPAKVTAKIFNSKDTFNVPMTYMDIQLKESFTDGAQFVAFWSAVGTQIENRLEMAYEDLIMGCVRSYIGELLYSEFESGKYGDGSGVRAINLLYLYNKEYGTTKKCSEVWNDPTFFRFCSRVMKCVINRLPIMQNKFNIEGKDRFTSRDKLHMMILNDFMVGNENVALSDTFNDEYTKFPSAELVPYWQGSGIGNYELKDITSINVKTDKGHEVATSGILAFMFDEEAIVIYNTNNRTTADHNGMGEYTNMCYKSDAHYTCDYSENAIVFYMADPTE